MSIKNMTMKARITIISFFIMIITVVSIMLTDYILQKKLLVVKIDVSKMDIEGQNIDENTPLNSKSFVSNINKDFERQKQIKFFWLITIGTVILGIGMSVIYVVIRRELRPLENLKKTMDIVDFQSKEINLIIPENNAVEIKSLSNSYNIMIEKLKKSYDLQKRFSQNAAHELRTPITTMKTSLQVNKMINKIEDEETNNLLDVFEGQVLRMEQLIDGLLLLNSNRSLEKEIVDISKVVYEVLYDFKEKIKEKDIEIAIIGKLEIETDKDIIFIILRNIIENAIRYNKYKGKIEVKLTNNIEIIDTGIGIPEDKIENIFSPFYCVDDSRSREFGGLGLGLSIVRESIDKLGFKFKIDSEIGRGTSFFIMTDFKIESNKC